MHGAFGCPNIFAVTIGRLTFIQESTNQTWSLLFSLFMKAYALQGGTIPLHLFTC